MKKALITIIILVFTLNLFGQEVKKTVASSGAIHSQSEAIKLEGTVGQPLIGRSLTGTQRAELGFWTGLTDNFSTSITEVDPLANFTQFYLGQNKPNPAQTITRIELGIPHKANIEVILYSLSGQRLGTLVKDKIGNGQHIVEMDVSPFPAGQYFYVLVYKQEIIASRKLIKF